MAVTMAEITKLRNLTSAGLMDCKKALAETDGDIEAAVEILRKKGQAVAAKREDRQASEGCVIARNDGSFAAILALNCETDFVAKNEKFMDFVTGVAKTIIAANPADVETLCASEFDGTGRTVTETLNDLVLAIGENMKIRRFEVMDGVVSTYVHGGGSVGVMIGFDVADDAKAADPAFDEMGKNVAMQIAAMNPAYLDEASVPAEVIEHEQGILAAQMKEDPKMASKPEAVLAKIAAGKMGKYYKENCLVEQEFVRSDLFQGAVKGYIDDVAKKLGTEIKANGFIRMTRGEGIEKRQENFAEEIAKQISRAININVGKEIDEALAKGSANLANAALTKEVQFMKDAAHDLRNYGKYHINMPVWGLRPKIWILAMVAFIGISVASLHFNRRQYLNNTRLEKVEWLYRNYRSIMSEEYMNDYILPREKIMFGNNTHKQDSLRNVIIKQEQAQISE